MHLYVNIVHYCCYGTAYKTEQELKLGIKQAIGSCMIVSKIKQKTRGCAIHIRGRSVSHSINQSHLPSSASACFARMPSRVKGRMASRVFINVDDEEGSFSFPLAISLFVVAIALGSLVL